MFSAQIIINNNNFGQFKGKKALVNKEQLDNIIEKSKLFYKSNGFELTLENGSFLVIPPDIVKNSILLVEVIEIKNKIKNEG